MPEKLKHFFNEEIVRAIAGDLSRADSWFRGPAFVARCMEGLDGLELTARGWHIAEAMREHLPRRFPVAAEIMMTSLGPELARTEGFGLAPFRYLPHVFFVAARGQAR